jgi:hypothetical protein
MARLCSAIAVIFLTLTAAGQINLTQGQPLAAGASGVLTTVPEIHSSAYPGTTLQGLLGLAACGNPCTIILDASSTAINSDDAAIGSASVVVQVVDPRPAHQLQRNGRESLHQHRPAWQSGLRFGHDHWL